MSCLNSIMLQGDTLDSISHEIAQNLVQRETFDSISHDIAQGLLTTTSVPQRYSFNATPPRDKLFGALPDHISAGQDPDTYKLPRTSQNSGTWTLSRGTWSDQDEVEDRDCFVQEYNCLAKKHKVRLFTPDDYNTDSSSVSDKPSTWFSRIIRRTSSTHSTKLKAEKQLKHKRSISDLSLRRASKPKHTLKDKNLQELVRLCGLSLLYLPAEHAPCSLAVPTCFRATAQYLVQHGPTIPGVFRIPGSSNTVTALYNHYCSSDEDGVIAGTVRCPTLPNHIQYDVHDVASTFKRLLSGVPGGILGSLALFDTLVSIQNQLYTDPRVSTRKRTQIRSRLVALAIATLKSQYRRELICAVFGLLSWLGYSAEVKATAASEHRESRPMSELMGYGPLGTVFGPLLIGDLLDNYNFRLANPYGGLILLPISSPKSRKEKQKERQKNNKSSSDAQSFSTHVDKIKIVNGITEMLITDWRDVVHSMKASQALRVIGRQRSLAVEASKRPALRPTASEVFASRTVPTWDTRRDNSSGGDLSHQSPTEQNGHRPAEKRRPKSEYIFRKRFSETKSTATLSKTVEEQASEVYIPPYPSAVPSRASTPRDTQLDRDAYRSTIEPLLTAKSNQNDRHRAHARKFNKPLPRVPNSSGKKQERVLRLRAKSSVPSFPDKHALERAETRTSLTEPPSPKIRSYGDRTMEYDLGLRRDSSELQRTLEGTMGGNAAFLNAAPTQEDLASLAELARVLLQQQPSGDSDTILHVPSNRDVEKDKHSHGEGTSLRESAARLDQRSNSSSSSMQKFFSEMAASGLKVHENSSSSSSPLPLFISRRRGGVSRQRISNIDSQTPAKPPEVPVTPAGPSRIYATPSKPAVKASDRFSTAGLPKTLAERCGIDTPLRDSPRGTVKALVAKFSLGQLSVPPPGSVTRGRGADIAVSLESPKGSMLSPYTRNPPSPARSQKSGLSDKSIITNNKQPDLDLTFSSPKKRSQIRTPMSQQEFKAPVNDAPSLIARRSPERITAPMEAPSEDQPLCRGTIMAPSPQVSKPAYGAHPPQSDIFRTQPTNNRLPTAGPSTPKRSPVPTRSNSILHGQIQTLQRQLAAKTEEVRQLRQQLEARSNPDVGILAENIMEAKREIGFWRSKAEACEKQLEMMRRTSARSNSSQGENLPTRAIGRAGRSNMRYSGDGSSGAGRNRNALHEMDGAGSSGRWNSERSSRATGQDLQGDIAATENGSWLEKAMRALA